MECQKYSKIFYFLCNSPIFIKYGKICKNNYKIIIYIPQNKHSKVFLLDHDLTVVATLSMTNDTHDSDAQTITHDSARYTDDH